MVSILFIWVLSGGELKPPVTETFYTLESCQAAARKAENARLIFDGIEVTDKVVAYCSPKKLGKDQ